MPVKFIAEVICPYCERKMSVNKEVEVISPMIPAEKRERVYAERISQTTLDTHVEKDAEEEEEP